MDNYIPENDSTQHNDSLFPLCNDSDTDEAYQDHYYQAHLDLTVVDPSKSLQTNDSVQNQPFNENFDTETRY